MSANNFHPGLFHCVYYFDQGLADFVLAGVFSKRDDADQCKAHLEATEQFKPVAISERTFIALKEQLREQGSTDRNRDEALMLEALQALEYHQEQTRPIERTSLAIGALRGRLAFAVRNGYQPIDTTAHHRMCRCETCATSSGGKR